MKLSRIGIALAKNVFQLHGVDRRAQAVWKRHLSRDRQANTAPVRPAVREEQQELRQRC